MSHPGNISFHINRRKFYKENEIYKLEWPAWGRGGKRAESYLLVRKPVG